MIVLSWSLHSHWLLHDNSSMTFSHPTIILSWTFHSLWKLLDNVIMIFCVVFIRFFCVFYCWSPYEFVHNPCFIGTTYENFTFHRLWEKIQYSQLLFIAKMICRDSCLIYMLSCIVKFHMDTLWRIFSREKFSQFHESINIRESLPLKLFTINR